MASNFCDELRKMTDDDMVKVADSIAYERRKSWMKLASKARKREIEAGIEEILEEIANTSSLRCLQPRGELEDWVFLSRC